MVPHARRAAAVPAALIGTVAAGIVAALLLIAAAESPRIEPLPPPPIALTPALLRCEVPAGAETTATFSLRAARGLRVLGVDAGCRCVQPLDALPIEVAAGVDAPLRLRVAGLQPGLRTLRVQTSAGVVEADLHVVVDGGGSGRDALAGLLTRAAAGRCAAWFVVHDLRGELRNCGCSAGSLGGIDHLAALPTLCRELAPGVVCRFLLSGDSDGPRTGVAAALAPFGYGRDDARVATGDVAAALARPETVAVLTPRREVAHRRVIVPLLDGGLVVEALLVDAQGAIVEHTRIAIDRSLPSAPGVLAAFAREPAVAVVADADPSRSCAGCHGAAHASWSASRHAQAWQRLAEADRTAACARCHTTPTARGLAGGVHCQSCHVGADAHAADHGRRTAGIADCRGCHDSRAHPGFDRMRAWESILHGR